MDDDVRLPVSTGKVPLDEPPRLLIVDDDHAVRALLVTVLKREGYAIDAVRNGAEAIEKIATSEYAAILLDLMMPVVDGYEIISYLERTAPKTLSACVIVLTAVSNAELRRLEGKPIFRIIRKPFDIDELASAVAECVRGRDSSLTATPLAS